MTRPSLAIVVAMLALLALPALAATPDFGAMQVQPYNPPRAAPTFALPDLDGKAVRLEELKGKVVMLVFWATW
jgi:cytochrome oxidase Cu insertion factor (SCO1/SenC/PrrC family)